MAKTMTVRPAREGEIVRMPERGYRALEADGEDVPCDGYWMKRLREGDVKKIAKKSGRKVTPAPATKEAD